MLGTLTRGRCWGTEGLFPDMADGCFASSGSSLGCFHWSQGVKLRASMRLLLEWLRSAGFEQLAQQFFAKLTSVANLLAMPGSQLVQVRDAQPGARGIGMGRGRRAPPRCLGRPYTDASLLQPATSCPFPVGGQYPGEDVLALSILPDLSLLCPLQAPAPQRKQFLTSAIGLMLCVLPQMTWPSLRAEFPALSPAQLHRVLSQCQAVMDVGCISAWQPSEEESPAAFQPGESWSAYSSHTQTKQVIPFPFLGVL